MFTYAKKQDEKLKKFPVLTIFVYFFFFLSLQKTIEILLYTYNIKHNDIIITKDYRLSLVIP